MATGLALLCKKALSSNNIGYLRASTPSFHSCLFTTTSIPPQTLFSLVCPLLSTSFSLNSLFTHTQSRPDPSTMQNTASLIVLVGALLPAASIATGIKVHNNCDRLMWINEVAPHAMHDSWSYVKPRSWWTASQPTVPGQAGVTAKIAGERSLDNIFQLEVATTADGKTTHYDMSSANGNPYYTTARRLGCYPNHWMHDSQFCGPSQFSNQCGIEDKARVMNARADCGDIVLELCAEQ